MRIVIDMQGAQTESRFRGIGRYTMAFAQAVVRNRGEHEVLLALSGLFPDTIEPIRAAFDGLLPQENIRVWYAPGPVRECEPGNAWRREAAEHIREAFLASLHPDVVHVTSLFEGYVDDAVTSIGVFAPQLKTVVSLYGAEPRIDLGGVGRQSSAYSAFQTKKREHLQHANAVIQLDATDAECDPAAHVDQDWPVNPLSVIEVYEGVCYSDKAANHHVDGEVSALLDSLAAIRPRGVKELDLLAAASAVSLNNPENRQRNLYVDISDLVQKDLRTGIQRVTRSILRALQCNPPEGYQVAPVYATQTRLGYWHARQFEKKLVSGGQAQDGKDDMVDPQPGDVFLGLDFVAGIVAAQHQYLTWMRNHGVRVHFVVYDLLPIKLPHAFPAGADTGHRQWLQNIAEFDGAVCISRAVQADLDAWLEQAKPKRLRPFKTDWFHLGADIENSAPSQGMPDGAEDVLSRLAMRPSFLMVGTLEPRKGHAHVLDAFEHLWRTGVEANLVIIGKQGWLVDKLIDRLRNHSELNNRLFWLESISDEYLEQIYPVSTCLIAASEGEGFGLPLIEAAQHKLPIIARDIPVFREVADRHAFYFSDVSANSLAEAIIEWRRLYEAGDCPRSTDLPWLTWRKSAQQLLGGLKLNEANDRAHIAVRVSSLLNRNPSILDQRASINPCSVALHF